MKVTMMLADSAQAIDGKLYVLGGGWTLTGPPVPCAVVAILEFDPDEPAGPYDIKIDLTNEDGGKPDLMALPGFGDVGDLGISAHVDELVEGPEAIPGDPRTVTLAANLPPIPFKPGTRYRWQLWINNNPRREWSVGFRTRNW